MDSPSSADSQPRQRSRHHLKRNKSLLQAPDPSPASPAGGRDDGNDVQGGGGNWKEGSKFWTRTSGADKVGDGDSVRVTRWLPFEKFTDLKAMTSKQRLNVYGTIFDTNKNGRPSAAGFLPLLY